MAFQSFFNLVKDFAALELGLLAEVATGAGCVIETFGVDGDDDGPTEAEIVLKREVHVRHLALVCQASQLKKYTSNAGFCELRIA